MPQAWIRHQGDSMGLLSDLTQQRLDGEQVFQIFSRHIVPHITQNLVIVLKLREIDIYYLHHVIGVLAEV